MNAMNITLTFHRMKAYITTCLHGYNVNMVYGPGKTTWATKYCEVCNKDDM